jgi:hypothetical protein
MSPASAASSKARYCRGSKPGKKLEQLGRYEVHLDRKLERMLSMLLRLKDLRQGAIEG